MARDVLDLTKQRQVEQTLASDYDIVIFMFVAVWQHIYERHGAGVAERVAVDLARRCAGTFIARPAPLALADAFTHITELEGFELAREWRGTPAKAGERVDDLQPRSSATLKRERSATVSFYR